MKTPILLLLAGAGFCAAADSPPDQITRRAEVTLPYSEVRALLDAARPQPPLPPAPPPMPSAVTSAKVSLSFNAAHPTAAAEFEVEVLAAGWQLVPLIGSPFALVTSAPAEATLVPSDGMLCLLANHPGRTHVTLAFEIPANLAQPAGKPFALRFPPTAAGRVEIHELPSRFHAVLRNGDFQNGDGTLPVPTAGGEISICISEDKPVLPTAWKSDVRTLIVERDDRLVCESHIHLAGESGSGSSARIELPRDATGIALESLDMRPGPQSTTGAGMAAEVAWETSGILTRDIVARYELPVPGSGDRWTIEPPRTVDAKAAYARTVIVPLPGVALSAKEIRDDSHLPAWMVAAAGGNPAFEVDSPTPFVVDARALPRLEADTARISEARYHNRIVSDGARICEARIAIQHRGALRWRFSLPKGSELLSCEIGGRATNPLLLENGMLELLIEADQDTSLIEFSYTEHGPAFAPVEGKLAVSVPATPLFTENLLWTVEIPDAYEATAFEGNVDPEGGGSDITFHKRLVRNEAASIEIYYRKRETTH